MASQPELSDDAEVQRLLSELKQYTPNIPIANLDQPAPVVQKLWGDLHFAWWRATVQRLSQSSEDSPVPNWAKWIQAHTTPACLDVALHWVFGEQWMNIGASGAKENPYSRIATVAKRLGLDPASHSTPWLLFLFLGTDVLSSPKCMKTISAFIGHQPASFDPNVLLCAINDKAVRRHGLDNIHSAPQVRRKDVIRTISDLDSTLQASSTPKPESTRPDQKSTPLFSSDGTAPVVDITAGLRPRDLRERLATRLHFASPSPIPSMVEGQGVPSPFGSQGTPTANRNNDIVGPRLETSISEHDEDSRQSIELGRQLGTPVFEPDVTMENPHQRSSNSTPSPTELQHYIEALKLIRRVDLSSTGDDNFRAITDSLFNLAGVALSQINQSR